MAHLEPSSCRKARADIKRQLTCSEKLLASIDNDTDLDILNLEARLEKHLTLWDKFETIQTVLDDELEDESEVENSPHRTDFENRYHKICGLFIKFIRKLHSGTTDPASSESVSQVHFSNQTLGLMSSEPTPDSNVRSSPSDREYVVSDVPLSNSSNSQRAGISQEDRSSGIDRHIQNSLSIREQVPLRFKSHFELPRLQTPTFYGSFDTWLTFHDSFKSMCHDNPDIPPIQKFHYLKACLKDEAAEVIASLGTTEENYEDAWDMLKRRYDNRKYIVENHVKAIHQIPPISKDFTVHALLDNFQKRLRALKALGQPVDQWDVMIIHLMKERLNDYLLERWADTAGTSKLPTLNQMLSFLEHRSLMDTTQSDQKQNTTHEKSQPSKGNLHSRFNPRYTQTCMATSVEDKKDKFQPSCHLCAGSHPIYVCERFLNMSPSERYGIIKKTNLSHNCLLNGHRTIDCRRGTCRKCRQRHNTLLHFNNERQLEKEIPQTITTALASCQNQSQGQVVLGTAIINILDSQGHYQPCRALLDSCSQCCSITNKLANSLGLSKRPINIQLKGAQNLQSQIKYTTSTEIKSRYSDDFELDVDFLIFQEISDSMLVMPIVSNSLKIPNEIFLADPEFHKSAEVDLLIGAEFFFDSLLVGKIKVPNQSAVFQETVFGWMFSGRYNNPQFPKRQSQSAFKISCNLIQFRDLPILWKFREESSTKLRSDEEKAAESHFSKTIKRLDSGRYEVQLPFNEKIISLEESRNTAFQRFHALERKFTKNPDLQKSYVECFQGYLDEGHMSLISNEEASSSEYYLPHHAVIKKDSLTTKTRVVFDGSAKTTTGISLNDTFMVGPTIQDDLFSIVTRFRSHPVALTADIQQMYRQICVSDDNKLFQKVLWRKTPEEPIQIYSLNTVTFGTACAPFLANRTLHKLAEDEEEAFPEAAKILRRDFYVDDLQTGAETIQEALQLRDDLIRLLQKGGFNLRKWASNKPELSSDFPNDSSNDYMSLDPSDAINSLASSV